VEVEPLAFRSSSDQINNQVRESDQRGRNANPLDPWMQICQSLRMGQQGLEHHERPDAERNPDEPRKQENALYIPVAAPDFLL
jgi:hypothetical protein